MNTRFIPFAHIDMFDIAEDLEKTNCADDRAEHIQRFLQKLMPVGVTLAVESILDGEGYFHICDGMTGVETIGEVWLEDLDELPGATMRLLDDLELMAAEAHNGLIHVPFAMRSEKRNAFVVLDAIRERAGAATNYVGTKHGVAIYRLPGSFPMTPIFAIDMAEAFEWASLLDAQFAGVRTLAARDEMPIYLQ